VLATELRHSTPEFSPLPKIAARIGIDLNILDFQNDEDMDWLRALIWPEHLDRLQRLDAALAVARAGATMPEPMLLQGGAAERWRTASLLPDKDSALTVYHTHALNQFDSVARAEFEQRLSETSLTRQIFELGNDFTQSPDGGVTYELLLRHWRDGIYQQTHLANVDGHGRYVEWLI
jgi:hypothetical protein